MGKLFPLRRPSSFSIANPFTVRSLRFVLEGSMIDITTHSPGRFSFFKKQPPSTHLPTHIPFVFNRDVFTTADAGIEGSS